MSELLLGRYDIPQARDESCLLAQHEAGVWADAMETAMDITSKTEGHRNEDFNKFLLPRVRALVLATGHRMAYEAAKICHKVTPAMLRLYETTCILSDPGWYVEQKQLRSADLHRQHAEAVAAVLPSLEDLLHDSGAAAWATAPIMEPERWGMFVQRLPVFTHDGGKKANIWQICTAWIRANCKRIRSSHGGLGRATQIGCKQL